MAGADGATPAGIVAVGVGVRVGMRAVTRMIMGEGVMLDVGKGTSVGVGPVIQPQPASRTSIVSSVGGMMREMARRMEAPKEGRIVIVPFAGVSTGESATGTAWGDLPWGCQTPRRVCRA